MKGDAVTAKEFVKRLKALGLSHAGCGLPRRFRDRQIIFRSVARSLSCRKTYTEQDINKAITSWLTDMGFPDMIDHVSLRRHLVDEGYLIRDDAGSVYEVDAARGGELSFEEAVRDVDPIGVIRDARREAEQRRAEHLR